MSDFASSDPPPYAPSSYAPTYAPSAPALSGVNDFGAGQWAPAPSAPPASMAYAPSAPPASMPYAPAPSAPPADVSYASSAPPPNMGYASSAPPQNMGYAPAPYAPPANTAYAPAPQPSAWDQYCMRTEMRPDIQADLRGVIESTRVVLLLDDSGSMQTTVRPPGANAMTYSAATRWSELMGDVAALVELVTAISTIGIDIHFMNRPGLSGVTDVNQLAPLFQKGPAGGTPMIGSLRRIYETYAGAPGRVLVVLVTDGEPSDGNYNDLFRVLTNKPQNFYISLVECNDNEEEMDYLTGWDTQIPRFHNQEDYGAELQLVRQVQGPTTKFTRANYNQMIVLSPVFPQYAIDIRRAGGRLGGNFGGFNGQNGFSQQYPNNQCCAIL